jgi:hypothetical protein
VAALDARKVGHRQAPRSLLGGLVRCAECGGVMSRSARSYRCLPRSDGYKTSCGITVAGDSLDAYVTGLVLAALGEVRPPRRGKGPSSGADRLRAEVLRIRADLEAVAGMLGRGEMDLGEYRAAKQPLDVRLAAASSELTRVDAGAALERMAGPTATLAERWDQLDVTLRGRIVGTVIDSLVVVRAERVGQAFTPDRIEVRWAA